MLPFRIKFFCSLVVFLGFLKPSSLFFKMMYGSTFSLGPSFSSQINHILHHLLFSTGKTPSREDKRISSSRQERSSLERHLGLRYQGPKHVQSWGVSWRRCQDSLTGPAPHPGAPRGSEYHNTTHAIQAPPCAWSPASVPGSIWRRSASRMTC